MQCKDIKPYKTFCCPLKSLKPKLTDSNYPHGLMQIYNLFKYLEIESNLSKY